MKYLANVARRFSFGAAGRTYLVAGSGGPNFGDELITRAWMDYLAIRGWGVTLDCNGGPKVAARFHDLERRRVHAIRGVKAFANMQVKSTIAEFDRGSPRFEQALKLGLHAFNRDGVANRPELVSALRKIETSDVIHLSGGGYINSWKTPESAFLIGFLASASRRFGIAAYATGLGLTPLRLSDAASDLLFEAVSAFSLFEVRDAASHRALWRRGTSATSVVNGLDDSWLLPLERRRDGRRRLHLSFLALSDSGHQSQVYNAAAELAAEVDEVVEWACSPRLEPYGRRAVESRLGREIDSFDCPSLVYSPIKADLGDLMISQRFHPHMIAARLGVFGVYDLGSVYYTDKHLSIIQLGSPWRRFYNASALLGAPVCRRSFIESESDCIQARKRRLADAIYERNSK